jgi:oxygen-independent coproporphyrinogen-3 oxidase
LIQVKEAAGPAVHARRMDISDLIEKYDTRVPRYTSYPTAPHFGPAVDGAVYAGWLAALPADAPVSLYLHVPFCAQLCWYCGCHTTAVTRREPMDQYAETLLAEIDLVAAAIGRPLPVSHVHWGGGTPHALPPERLVQLMARLRARFAFARDADVAVEMDPRTADPEAIAALAEMGVTRASLGVQDFDPVVQQAVNRVQSFEDTAACAARLRALGIRSINLDLMYGLPHQTAAGVTRTVEQALDLQPDRIAVFGYAHVPWMKKHQALIPEAHLPDLQERYRQLLAAEAAILARGFVAIGMDHYARPDDPLAVAAAAQAMHRNFQGYTTDTAEILIGLGASSIGSLPQGYAQNAPSLPDWRDRVRAGSLPTARGIAVGPDDLLRRDVIEQLMCQGEVDLPATAARHAADAAPLLAVAPRLADLAEDGLIAWDGKRVVVREAARPLVRNVAALFDNFYRPQNEARHARAV